MGPRSSSVVARGQEYQLLRSGSEANRQLRAGLFSLVRIAITILASPSPYNTS